MHKTWRLTAIAGLFWTAQACRAQTGIQAHFADGQVWVRWTEDAVPPETYAIYVRNAPFSNTSQAQLAGRLFREEWLPTMLQQQASQSPAGWVIPDGIGSRDTLSASQGLFVHTPTASGNRWYSVVRWGDTSVTPGVNLAGPVSTAVSLADPPEPQLQHEYVQDGQWLLSWYAVWALGLDDHRAGRPDFPVMANRHKNGMPSFFLLSRPVTLPGGLRPLVHWLHGGGGTASQSRPGLRQSVGIDPVNGFLCAHNDDFIRYMQSAGIILQHTNSWHFGWTANHDPFDSTYVMPAPTDTVINYTQRRYTWIHAWLLDHFPIDPHRVAVQGHSVGSAGTTAWAKSFPQLFSTATVFNNGFMGPNDAALDELPPGAAVPGGVNLFGTRLDNLPTNLKRANGVVVRAYDLFDLTTPTSSERDLPLFRSLHGKNDDNGTMEWDADVVAQYRGADSLALGIHLYWDERNHGLGAMPSYFSHGNLASDQIQRDNVVYQDRYRNDVSYPAFFNHRLYPDSHDPGDGTRGTTADSIFSGDDWGTWGGFHDWSPDSIVDTSSLWEASIWLISGSAWLPDNCPFDSLTCDVAIRRPQSFAPLPGSLVYWSVSTPSGSVLQSGTTTVDANGLLRAAGIVAARDPNRRYLRFGLQPVDTRWHGDLQPDMALRVAPLPVRRETQVELHLTQAAHVAIAVFDTRGRRVATLARGRLRAGTHRIPWQPRGVASGVYFVQVDAVGRSIVRRVVVLQ